MARISEFPESNRVKIDQSRRDKSISLERMGALLDYFRLIGKTTIDPVWARIMQDAVSKHDTEVLYGFINHSAEEDWASRPDLYMAVYDELQERGALGDQR